jgi:hypothetical protein
LKWSEIDGHYFYLNPVDDGVIIGNNGLPCQPLRRVFIMSMQIQVDPAGLTQEQREAVAGFILAYPAKGEAVATLRVPKATAAAVAANPSSAVQALAAAVEHAPAPLDPEIAQLAKEGGEFDASVAFGAKPGDPDAAAAFGSAPAPLFLGATAAPFTAGAVPSLTAPENMPATTFAATVPNVPAPPAPTSENAGQVVAPPTANPAGGVELDKAGLPWDGRIHASTKTKTKPGLWAAKRGVDPALVVTVEAELRQVMGAAPAVAPVAPPAPPAAPVAPVAGGADPRQMFVGLVGRTSAAIGAGKVTQDEVTAICAKHGAAALPLLANRLDLVAQVAAEVDALIAAR